MQLTAYRALIKAKRAHVFLAEHCTNPSVLNKDLIAIAESLAFAQALASNLLENSTDLQCLDEQLQTAEAILSDVKKTKNDLYWFFRFHKLT